MYVNNFQWWKLRENINEIVICAAVAVLQRQQQFIHEKVAKTHTFNAQAN